MLLRKLVDDADDLVVHEAQPLGAMPAAAFGQQEPFGSGAPGHERRFEPLGDRCTQPPFIV